MHVIDHKPFQLSVQLKCYLNVVHAIKASRIKAAMTSLVAILCSNSDDSSSRPQNKQGSVQINGKMKKAFLPKLLTKLYETNVGLQLPYKLPVDAKEVEYLNSSLMENY